MYMVIVVDKETKRVLYNETTKHIPVAELEALTMEAKRRESHLELLEIINKAKRIASKSETNKCVATLVGSGIQTIVEWDDTQDKWVVQINNNKE